MSFEPSRTAHRLRAALSPWRAIAITGIVYFVSQAGITWLLGEIEPATVLRLQTTLSAQTFRDIVASLRESGLITSYWRHYLLDFVHPLWYALFLSACLARAFDATAVSSKFDTVLFVPFVAGGLDLVENLAHVVFLLQPDAIVAPLVVLSGLAAIGKWTLVTLCMLATAFVAARRFTAQAG